MYHTGKAYLVTGAASGLGAACAELLAKRGAWVLAVDKNRSESAGLNLTDPGGIEAVEADVCDSAAIATALEQASGHAGRLDAVIHCAGIAPAARVVGRKGPHDLELFRRTLEVNLVGTFNVVRLAAERMSSQTPGADGERGIIVTTASIAAFEGQIGQVAYAASKAGVAGMTLPLARELAAHGIRAVCVAPGVFETPLVGAMPEEVRQSLVRQVPFPRRFGRAEEYAALVAHILENPMLNGEVIRLDGALRMNP